MPVHAATSNCLILDFRLINIMILLPAFMSLAGGSHSILHQGNHLFSSGVHPQVTYDFGHAVDIMSVNTLIASDGKESLFRRVSSDMSTSLLCNLALNLGRRFLHFWRTQKYCMSKFKIFALTLIVTSAYWCWNRFWMLDVELVDPWEKLLDSGRDIHAWPFFCRETLWGKLARNECMLIMLSFAAAQHQLLGWTTMSIR